MNDEAHARSASPPDGRVSTGVFVAPMNEARPRDRCVGDRVRSFLAASRPRDYAGADGLRRLRADNTPRRSIGRGLIAAGDVVLHDEYCSPVQGASGRKMWRLVLTIELDDLSSVVRADDVVNDPDPARSSCASA